MINSPIAQTPEQVKRKELRKVKFMSFHAKYPFSIVAWIERQPDRTFWRVMVDKLLPPEQRVLIIAGKGLHVRPPVCAQDLTDCWFRAAWTMLVRPIGDRDEGDFTAKELAKAFGIPLTRYQGLIDRERAWSRRPKAKPLRVQLARLTAGQPDIADLYNRLIK